MAKFQSLREAVAENLHDGDTAAFEGFTHLIPNAAAHEVIRQGRKDLTLIRMTPEQNWTWSCAVRSRSAYPMLPCSLRPAGRLARCRSAAG